MQDGLRGVYSIRENPRGRYRIQEGLNCRLQYTGSPQRSILVYRDTKEEWKTSEDDCSIQEDIRARPQYTGRPKRWDVIYKKALEEYTVYKKTQEGNTSEVNTMDDLSLVLSDFSRKDLTTVLLIRHNESWLMRTPSPSHSISLQVQLGLNMIIQLIEVGAHLKLR